MSKKARLRTESEYRSAKAPAGARAEIRDNHPDAEGLALRISERGSKAWSLRYRLADGTMRRITLGAFPAVPLASARERARGIKAAVADGQDPQADKRRKRAEALGETIRTFDDLAQAYFTACESGRWAPRKRKKAASTLAEERALYRRHIKGVLGHERPDDIDRQACRRLFDQIAATAPISSNRARSLTRQIFAFAMDRERVAANPVIRTPAPVVEAPRERVLTDAELRALWDVLQDPASCTLQRGGQQQRLQISRGMGIALWLALLTAQRRGEVAGMQLAELDLDAATWIIPAERSKNRRANLVPLSPPALALIREALALADARRPEGRNEPLPCVFPGARNSAHPITAHAMTHAASAVFEAAGIAGARLHDLRRTAATLMASERCGVSPYVVSAVLNHLPSGGGGSTTTAKHYVHAGAAAKRSALEAWAALLAEITGQAQPSSNVTPIRAAR